MFDLTSLCHDGYATHRSTPIMLRDIIAVPKLYVSEDLDSYFFSKFIGGQLFETTKALNFYTLALIFFILLLYLLDIERRNQRRYNQTAIRSYPSYYGAEPTTITISYEIKFKIQYEIEQGLVKSTKNLDADGK